MLRPLQPSISPPQETTLRAIRHLGPMGLARSAGQALYDLAISNVDGFIGSRERFGTLLYDRYIEKGEPTPHFFRVWENLYPHSMVRDAEVSFAASMARVAAVELMADGSLNADQTHQDKG